jgi:hypothetical protein
MIDIVNLVEHHHRGHRDPLVPISRERQAYCPAARAWPFAMCVSYRAVSPTSRPFNQRWYMYSSEDDDGSRSASLAHHLLSPDRSLADDGRYPRERDRSELRRQPA